MSDSESAASGGGTAGAGASGAGGAADGAAGAGGGGEGGVAGGAGRGGGASALLRSKSYELVTLQAMTRRQEGVLYFIPCILPVRETLSCCMAGGGGWRVHFVFSGIYVLCREGSEDDIILSIFCIVFKVCFPFKKKNDFVFFSEGGTFDGDV